MSSKSVFDKGLMPPIFGPDPDRSSKNPGILQWVLIPKSLSPCGVKQLFAGRLPTRFKNTPVAFRTIPVPTIVIPNNK